MKRRHFDSIACWDKYCSCGHRIEYYVAPNGNDNHDGSFQKPFQTN